MLKWWLPHLLARKDRNSMSHGIEVRVPFTDHELMQYVWNVPWSMRAAKGIEKQLLRDALVGLLPHDVLNRRKVSASMRRKWLTWLCRSVSFRPPGTTSCASVSLQGCELRSPSFRSILASKCSRRRRSWLQSTATSLLWKCLACISSWSGSDSMT